MRTARRLSVISLAILLLSSPLPAQSIRPAAQKPAWWLQSGISFVGNWEPLEFRVRGGHVPHDPQARWEWEHAESTVAALKKAGVNTVITHFYKGLGPEHERASKVYTRKLVEALKKNGMFAGAYIGSTLFSETLFQERPEAADWVQRDHNGEPIVYADQYYRERADFTHPGYRELIKGQVTEALRDYGMNLIHFDNFYTMFPLDAGYTEHIQSLFREYLKNKYTPEQRLDRLGFAEVDRVRPPRVENHPMAPVVDPLVQEWITFRVEALTGFIRELSEHIRTVDPEAVVEFNPHGVWGQNCAYSNGMDHARLLPLCDIFWSEDPDQAHYYPEQNRLVSKIRSFKTARRFGDALFSYNGSPLELAESMAFNRMCPGDVGWPILDSDSTGRGKDIDRRFLAFFNANRGLFRDLEPVADIGVMRDFDSMTFTGWAAFLTTIQAEQTLIQTRAPFTLLFNQDWESLSAWRAVVLAEQQNLSDERIAALKAYVERGGALAVVGATGRYDQWRREREGDDRFWVKLGLPAPLQEPGQPARLTLGRGRVFYIPAFDNPAGVPAQSDQVEPEFWGLPLNWTQFKAGLDWALGSSCTVQAETAPHVAAEYYRAGGRRLAHLVNYWPGHPVADIPLLWTEKGFRPHKAAWHCPGQAPKALELKPLSDGGVRVTVPELDIYGVLELE